MSPIAAEESLGARRNEIEELVCDLPGGRDGDRGFDEPWQIRAFALAVGAHKAGEFEWSAFQGALIGSIREWEESAGDVTSGSWSYYEHWVRALEVVLDEVGAIGADALDSRTREVLAIPPNRGHHEARLDPIAIDPATRN